MFLVEKVSVHFLLEAVLTAVFASAQEGSLGYDEFLRQVKPRRGKWWELAMTEDQDVGWLGLHHFDNR